MPAEVPANLKSSILDRLVDVSVVGPASAPWYAPAEVIDAVRRDLETLLNTRQTSQGLCEGYPEVTDSLITFGIPDASALKTFTAADREAIARRIEQSIRRFEPRLSHVKVTVLAPTTRKDRVLRLHIAGRLAIEPASDIEFDAAMELTTGRVSMVTPS